MRERNRASRLSDVASQRQRRRGWGGYSERCEDGNGECREESAPHVDPRIREVLKTEKKRTKEINVEDPFKSCNIAFKLQWLRIFSSPTGTSRRRNAGSVPSLHGRPHVSSSVCLRNVVWSVGPSKERLRQLSRRSSMLER